MKNKEKFSVNIGKNKVIFHFGFLKNIIQNTRSFFSYGHLGIIMAMAGSFLILYYLVGWSERVSFFVVFAIVIWTRMWDARIATMGGILCLFVAMVLTVFYSNGFLLYDFPETFSVWAYSFFVVAVIGQIIEFRYNKKPQDSINIQTQKKVQQKQYFMDVRKK